MRDDEQPVRSQLYGVNVPRAERIASVVAGGTLALLGIGRRSISGVHSGLVDRFPMGAALAKGLTLKLGQTRFHKYAPELLARVQSRQIDPSFVITHRVALEDLPEAYAMFDAKRDGCIKVVAR